MESFFCVNNRRHQQSFFNVYFNVYCVLISISKAFGVFGDNPLPTKASYTKILSVHNSDNKGLSVLSLKWNEPCLQTWEREWKCDFVILLDQDSYELKVLADVIIKFKSFWLQFRIIVIKIILQRFSLLFSRKMSQSQNWEDRSDDEEGDFEASYSRAQKEFTREAITNSCCIFVYSHLCIFVFL